MCKPAQDTKPMYGLTMMQRTVTNDMVHHDERSGQHDILKPVYRLQNTILTLY